jgi:hypothetical protein
VTIGGTPSDFWDEALRQSVQGYCSSIRLADSKIRTASQQSLCAQDISLERNRSVQLKRMMHISVFVPMFAPALMQEDDAWRFKVTREQLAKTGCLGS